MAADRWRGLRARTAPHKIPWGDNAADGGRVHTHAHASSNPRAALVLFCRRPLPGDGKRRLARALGDMQALAVARALLQCALEDAAQWPGPLILSPSQPGDTEWAGQLLRRAARVIPQPDGNLGERIAAVDTLVRREGCDRVLFIGSDAPSLHSLDLAAASETLDRSDVVLIPAADGGVTLMGSRAGWPDLSGLPWSEATLGSSLAHACRTAALTVTVLEGSYDVDGPADCLLAIERLAQDERPARRRLRALLTELTFPPAMPS